MRPEIRTAFLAADIRLAYTLLQSLPEPSRDEERLVRYLRRTFFEAGRQPPTVPEDDFVGGALGAYRRYWVSVLAGETPEETASRALSRDLGRYLDLPLFANIDEVEAAIGGRFAAAGYGFLGGYTLPFLGPYIWRSEVAEDFSVHIPSGVVTVRLHWLQDMIACGWLDFATGGRIGTAGWAKPEGLYAVYRRYRGKLASSSFQVSYLKHEAQHLDDYRRWGELPAQTLEYRAKLVELAYAPGRRLLERFRTEAGAQGHNPHADAAARVTAAMAKRFGTGTAAGGGAAGASVRPGEIRGAALELLRESDEELSRGENITA